MSPVIYMWVILNYNSGRKNEFTDKLKVKE